MIKPLTCRKKNLLLHYKFLALSPFLFSTFFAIENSYSTESFQANDWQCESLDNGRWDCSVSSENNNADMLGFVDGSNAENETTDTKPGNNSNKSEVTSIVTSVEADFTEAQSSEQINSLKSMPIEQRIVTPSAPVMNTMWSSCAVQMDDDVLQDNASPQSDETNVDADYAETPDNSQINFSGNVIITKNDRKLVSDKANYNKATRVFDAQGNVIITQPDLILHGESARYQTDVRKGRVDNAQYRLIDSSAQGVAKSVQFKPGKIGLEDMTYSTCPAGDEDWAINASTMDFYTDEAYGEGTHAVMKFKGVPIFYTPYIRFPFNDERQSGFLMPSIGSTDNNGFEIATPYYFNIAPNQDATVTPKYFSDRGFMLGGEYRYLTETYSGEFYAEGINDDIYDDRRDVTEVRLREGSAGLTDIDKDNKVKPRDISDNRGAFSIQQRANWKNSWSGSVDYNYVSDNYYLEDFGNNLRDKSTSHLLREGKVNYNGSTFKFMAMAQGYQELIHSAHTYSRLPQMTLTADEDYSVKGFDMNTGFDSEFVMFAQNWDDFLDSDKRVEGSRLHLKPYISMPFKNSYSFIIPKFSVDMVTYQLDNEDTDPTDISDSWNDDSPNRATPIFSLDTGLFFDKELSLFDTPMKQTLEPRLFYLNIPEDDQSDIPLFDTGLNTFSYSQIFRENRFNGVDRFGDANQLTAGLTSRFIDAKSGEERFKASFGQIYYFEDREVLLNYSNPVEKEYNKNSSSSIAGEISSQFTDNWYTGYTILYNPHNGGSLDESRYRLQYKSDPSYIINFDYTYSGQTTARLIDEVLDYDLIGKKEYEQFEVSTYWQVMPRWRFLAHWYYSLYDNKASQILNGTQYDNRDDGYTLESKIGIEYDSCCYAVRLVIGRDQENYYAEADNSIMLQFQFKGLGSIAQGTGSHSGESLTESIPGFEDWTN